MKNQDINEVCKTMQCWKVNVWGPGDEVQLIKCLPSALNHGFNPLHHIQLGPPLILALCSVVEIGGSGVDGYSWLHDEFMTSLSYMRPCLKNPKSG